MLATEDGANIYFARDTGVFGDMKLAADLYAPQLAIMPVEGKHNIGVKEAAYAAHHVRPGVFIPIHYSTSPDQQANLERLRDLVKALPPGTELIVLKSGESYTYPP